MCGGNSSSQNKENLQQCIVEKSINLGQCIIDCNREQTCEQSCVNMFNEQYDQCPCQVGISYAAYGLYHIGYMSSYMIQDIKKSILERIGISDEVSFNDF